MSPNEVIGGLSFAAILAAAWQQVRLILLKAISLAIVRVKVHHPLGEKVSSYCFRNFERSPFGLLTYHGSEPYVRPAKRHQLVAFEGRKNIADRESGLSFDCLLNCLSGIEAADGVFVVVTTNRIEQLDPALGVPRGEGTVSTRPGRVDRALELGPMNDHCRRKLAARILDEHPHHIERVVAEGAGDTGAQFQDRCAQLALSEHWRMQVPKKGGFEYLLKHPKGGLDNSEFPEPRSAVK